MRHRIEELDGVRAVAILSVFAHHALHVKLLWMGVDLFFVLSGFLITGILLDGKRHQLASYFGHFYSRRARRIIAPYLSLLALASIPFGVAWLRHWYFYILLTNFLDPLSIPHPNAFTPLWSLAVEEQFYLFWPFAVYFLSERNLRRLSIGLLIAAPVLRGVFHFQNHWPIYMLTPFRMDLLAAGSLLAIEWRHRRELVTRYGTLMAASLITVGAAVLLAATKVGLSTYGNTRTGNVLIYEGCLLIAVGGVLFAMAGSGARWLRWKPVTYVGRISYSMYLAHLGILVLVARHFHGFPMAAIGLTLTIAYAVISWHFMERWLLSDAHRKPQPGRIGSGSTVPQEKATPST